MPHRQLLCRILMVSCLVAVAAVGRGQEIIDNVPRDALAFLVVRDLSGVQAQFMRFSNPNAMNPAIDMFPIGILNATIGNNRGLDRRGDLLFVVRSGNRSLAESPLCVWLPVSDYPLFVRTLGGKPEEPITVITIQRQDVLCAHHGKWALIMDANERQRLEATLDGEPQPPGRLAAWRDWLLGNSIAVAVFPNAASREALRDWAGGTTTSPAAAASSRAIEDLFSPARPDGSGEERGLAAFRKSLGKALSTSPQLSQLAIESDAAALGVRIDAGNLRAGLRMAWPDDRWRPTAGEGKLAAPTLHREGEFTFSGGGKFPSTFTKAVAESFVLSAMAEMRAENPRSTFDAALIDQFVKASEAAAAQIAGATVFHTPGGEKDGVFTNHFLAVRVPSAVTFSSQIAEAMRLWNEISSTAQPSTKSVFESKLIEIGGRKATQYSLDIAASEGLPDEPTLRQTMERLFGPDRKMHRFVVEVDANTVLLAGATADQIAATLKFLKDATPGSWNASNVAISNQLLPEQADWKLFANPNGYTKWLQRTNLVTFGEVVGAPPLELFPLTPPVSFAGSFPEGQLSVEFAVPADSLRVGQAYRVRRSARARAGR